MKRPDRAKPSSPTRASASDHSSTAFPILEETAVPVPETEQNLPTRSRRRSASFRERGAVEAFQRRDAQIAATVKTEAPIPIQPRPSAFREEFEVIMPKSKVFKPGPAKLKPNSSPQEWLQCALRNKYLPENIMKELCEICKRALMEGKPTPSLKHHKHCRLTMTLTRIQYPACIHSCHCLRRSPRSILRRPRTFPCRRRYSERR